MVRIVRQIPVHGGGGDMSVRLYTVHLLGHWEVRVLVRAHHIVRLEAGIEPVSSPGSATCTRRFEDHSTLVGVELDVVLCSG